MTYNPAMVRLFVLASFVAVAATGFGLPSLAHAASYAYVDQSGQVRMTTADSSQAAQANAIDIDENSGVMLMDSTTDDAMIGDQVSG